MEIEPITDAEVDAIAKQIRGQLRPSWPGEVKEIVNLFIQEREQSITMNKTRYLVCRADAVRPIGTIRTSEYFPTIVWAINEKEAIYKALGCTEETYMPFGPKVYVVIPMDEARIVRLELEPPQTPRVKMTIRKHEPFVGYSDEVI